VRHPSCKRGSEHVQGDTRCRCQEELSQHRRECTEAEANVILGAGLALMVVQHVAPRSGYRRKRL